MHNTKTLRGPKSLDFCCRGQTVGPEYRTKAWIDGVEDIFTWHALDPPPNLVLMERGLNTKVYLRSLAADDADPFMTTVYYLLMASSSRITRHVAKLRSSQTGSLNVTMMGCGGTAEWHTDVFCGRQICCVMAWNDVGSSSVHQL